MQPRMSLEELKTFLTKIRIEPVGWLGGYNVDSGQME